MKRCTANTEPAYSTTTHSRYSQVEAIKEGHLHYKKHLQALGISQPDPPPLPGIKKHPTTGTTNYAKGMEIKKFAPSY